MPAIIKPFVHIAIDQVDAVIEDREGRYDPERFDRYETFEAARDAALTSIEVMLDVADYDGDDHLEELERMRELLESSQSFAELKARADYRWFLNRLAPAFVSAA